MASSANNILLFPRAPRVQKAQNIRLIERSDSGELRKEACSSKGQIFNKEEILFEKSKERRGKTSDNKLITFSKKQFDVLDANAHKSKRSD